MKKFNVLTQMLREKWVLLSFLLFTWLIGSWILNSAWTSDEKAQLSKNLKLTNSLVVNQLQFLQLELGHFLSEELSIDTRTSAKVSSFQSQPKKFAGLGIVKDLGGKLFLEKFFRGTDAGLTEEFIQKQLDWLNPMGGELGQQGYFWVDRGSNQIDYLFSFLPYELDGKSKAWGLGVSQIPTPWLELSGSQNAFLIEKQTRRILSAFGGENQGGVSEVNIPLRSASDEMTFSLHSEESQAWQSVPGTNLIILLKEPARSFWQPWTLFLVLSLTFMVGLLFLSSSRDEAKELVSDLQEVQPETTTTTKKKTLPPSAPAPAPVSEPKAPVQPVETPQPMALSDIDTKVEDRLLETILNKGTDEEEEGFGYKVAEGVSDAIQSLAQEIQSASVRVNLLVPENVRSNWPQTQLKTVLEEIIRNSLEAMENSETRTLTFTTTEQGEFIDLLVEDTGSGMTDEVLQRALEAFFSTKPSLNKRRGLGLNVAKRLLEISGGALSVDSTPGIGTKVTLRFLREYEDELDDGLNFELNG